MTKTQKQIIEEVRKEFGINEREWYYSCFEGDYVPNMIERALQKQHKEIFKEYFSHCNKLMKHQKDIHTFICEVCGYKEWYPDRIGDKLQREEELKFLKNLDIITQ